MSVTKEERSRLRQLAESYAQALVAFRIAERDLQEQHEAYIDYVNGLVDPHCPKCLSLNCTEPDHQ